MTDLLARVRVPLGFVLSIVVLWLARPTPRGLLLGAVVRAALIGRFSPWSFYAVTFAVALLLLGGWRGLFAFGEGRLRTDG